MEMNVELGNIGAINARRLANAAGRIDGIAHHDGCTEPWVSRLVADFIVATGAYTVVETGSFIGATSVYILDALNRLGGGHFDVCEIDLARQVATRERLGSLKTADVHVAYHGDVLSFLGTLDYPVDVAFVDDTHTKEHVGKEIMLLYPKMRKGGLILLHDVWGSVDLQSVVARFGGYSIDLPRTGPAGGLGVIQTQ